MAILAILTLVLGLLSGPISKTLSKITENITALNGSGVASVMQFSSINTQDGFASVSMPSIFLALTIIIALVAVTFNFISRKQKVKLGTTWDCGSELSPRMEITATGFSRSIISIFKNVLKPTQETETQFHNPDDKYFLKTSTVNLGIRDVYKSYFYNPFHGLVINISEYAKKIQSGNVNAYILYIFLALIFLLTIGVIR
jgi:hydrogenase-4 component B